ncbi:MAG: type IV pilus biogenesis/stability protein PilW [Halieaceae bacterium]
MRQSISRCVIVAGLALLVSACVTQEGRVFTAEASPQEALKTRVQLARSYIGEQNWEDAKRNLKIAQEIDPNSAEVAEAFALVYQSTGEYELAEENFERAISLKKPFSRARNNYAAFLYSRGRYAESERQLEVVVKDTLYESRPQAFVNLGLCRVRLGETAGAREAFTRALTMDRGNRIALLELAHIEYGDDNWALAQRYLDSYRGFSRSLSARALWLGVRLSHKLGEQDAEASYGLALRNLYPKSPEFQAYERAVQSGDY